MSTFIVLISITAVLVSICGLMVSFVTKRAWKPWAIWLAGSFIAVMIVGGFSSRPAQVAATPAGARSARSHAAPTGQSNMAKRRCAAGQSTSDGLSDKQVYELAYCLDAGNAKLAVTTPLYRFLAHRIGKSQNASGFDRDAFTRIWLRVAEANSSEGDLTGAKSSIDTAKPSSFGTRYRSELVALSDVIAPKLVMQTNAERAEQKARIDAAAQVAQNTNASSGSSEESGDSSADVSTDTSDSDSSSENTDNDTSSDDSSSSDSSSSEASSNDASTDTSTDDSGSSSDSVEQFDSPSGARAHCPSDTVVWLNLNSGIYHYAGERWYGKTLNGAYVCEHEAESAGDRATENGQ